MNRLKLVLPTPDYKSKIIDYRREFIENGDRIYGAGGLKNAESFNKWYISFCNNLNEETVRKGLSPETTYLAICIDDGHLVGMINIRHRLNDFLLKFGGHIDYSVRKSKRNKGYATEMLGLALKECTRLNIKKVLITCDKNNIASAKTIINNGAKLENEIKNKGKISQRYWITLK
ncbi:MAG: GNAT family N-acetyltransferase [Tissierellaceae bacterium]|nr:GNAT family N-acetyltransferase [Tissierellaceae bacterium]